ncbi:MAG: CBS domain-containing protein [Cyclobacteriaceae bacterium]|nr:CBS domain-containing protein [Cyclobacteriaceae bacterium]
MNTVVATILASKGHAVFTIKEHDTVFTALEQLAKHDVGALLVTDEHQNILGIFSERDYARKVAEKGKISRNSLINKLMNPHVQVIRSANTLLDCLNIMTKKHVRHLPVVDEGKLLGVVSIGDIVYKIINEQKTTIDSLEHYISGSDYGSYIEAKP